MKYLHFILIAIALLSFTSYASNEFLTNLKQGNETYYNQTVNRTDEFNTLMVKDPSFLLTNQFFIGHIQVGNNQYNPNYSMGSNSTLFYQLQLKNGTSLQNSTTDIPVILWLQGGPGCSSWPGATLEFGAYKVRKNSSSTTNPYYLIQNHYTWAIDAHLIFVDNPIGVGLSVITPDSAPLPNNTEESVANMHSFIKTFFQIYPELVNNPIYTFGESFAGHYIPALTSSLINNPDFTWLNLKAMGVGDGMTDAFEQGMGYAAFYNAVGIISRSRSRLYKQAQGVFLEAILNDQYEFAQVQNNLFTNGNPTYYDPDIVDLSGGIDNLNFKQYSLFEPQDDATPQWIQANNELFNVPSSIAKNFEYCSMDVYYNFAADMTTSYKQNTSLILQNLPVMFYQGQLDACILTTGIQNYINDLNWSGMEAFREAQKQNWTSPSNSQFGQYKKAGNLTYVMVNQAGHMVSANQPEAAQDLFRRFLNLNNESW